MSKSKKISILNLASISRGLILLSVFLIPLIFYPNGIHFFENLKSGLFFATALIVLILWSISALKKDDFNFPANLLSLSICDFAEVVLQYDYSDFVIPAPDMPPK